VLSRKQVCCGQVHMDGLHHLAVVCCRRGRLHVHDQVWLVRVAGLGQVHLVARPARLPLGGEAGVWIVRGLNEAIGRRKVVCVAPPNRAIGCGVILLDPDLTECLDRGYLAQPDGAAGS